MHKTKRGLCTFAELDACRNAIFSFARYKAAPCGAVRTTDSIVTFRLVFVGIKLMELTKEYVVGFGAILFGRGKINVAEQCRSLKCFYQVHLIIARRVHKVFLDLMCIRDMSLKYVTATQRHSNC